MAINGTNGNAPKIDRDMTTSFTLPKNALVAIRKAIAKSVADGITEGFNDAEKKTAKKTSTRKKVSTPKEKKETEQSTTELVKLGDETKKVVSSFASFKSGLGKISIVLGVVTTLLSKFKDAMELVETTSRQLITQGSLFTDKNIMSLMQQTGQSAEGATAMQRALDMLGISFNDIQSGNVTQTQMAEFQRIYKAQSESLTTINEKSQAMFETWQKFALYVNEATQGLKDAFVGVLGESGTIPVIVEQFKSMLDTFLPLIQDYLLPVVVSLFSTFASLLKILSGSFKNLLPVLELISIALKVVFEVISALLKPIELMMEYAQKLNIIKAGSDAIKTISDPYSGRGIALGGGTNITGSNNNSSVININNNNGGNTTGSNDLFFNGYLVAN